MSGTGLAVAHAVFLWWFGTGAVLYLDGLPRRTFPATLAGATAFMLAGLAGLFLTRDETGVGAAHIAFASAVAIWGWNEVLFLTGTVTGPRRGAQPAGDRGFRRFRSAAEAILYHELVLAASAIAVALAVGGGANRVGLWTFATLWVMRLSTKLNVFLGVRNLGENFLPDHLRYLATYFRRARMNPLLPVSVVASVAMLAALVGAAIDPETGATEATALTLVATLLALAILEHGFLVLPVDSLPLWRWGLASREARPAGEPTTLHIDTPRIDAAGEPTRS